MGAVREERECGAWSFSRPPDSFLSLLMAALNKEQSEMEKYGLQSFSPKFDKAEYKKVGLVPKGCSLTLTSPLVAL